MMVIRQVIELVVNPFFVSLCLLGLCTWFAWRRRHETFVRVGILTVFIVLLLISTGLSPYLSYIVETQYPPVSQVDPTVQWIVVLSGGQSDDKSLPPNQALNSATVERMVEGLRLFQLLPSAKLLISGGASIGEEPEAIKMAQLAAWFAIPKDKTIIEQHSLNTAAQAKNIKEIIHEQPFYLVTSAIHMPRAMKLCQAVGLHPIAAPTDFIIYRIESLDKRSFIPNTYNMTLMTIVFHEILGRVWAKIIGDI